MAAAVGSPHEDVHCAVESDEREKWKGKEFFALQSLGTQQDHRKFNVSRCTS